MIVSNRLKNQHLLWRAAFGPMAENAASLDDMSNKKLWQLLLKTSAKPPQKIEVADNLVDGLYKGVQDVVMQTEISKAEAGRKRRQESREQLKSLNLMWLDEMINSEAQLLIR